MPLRFSCFFFFVRVANVSPLYCRNWRSKRCRAECGVSGGTNVVVAVVSVLWWFPPRSPNPDSVSADSVPSTAVSKQRRDANAIIAAVDSSLSGGGMTERTVAVVFARCCCR